MIKNSLLAGMVTVVTILPAGGPGEAAELPVCWDDGAPSHNWADADNWNPSTVGGPRNAGVLEFLVTIGCLTPAHSTGAYDPVFFDASTPIEITDFFLLNDSRLILNQATDLTVLRTTEIAGILDGQGGSFTALGSGATITGNRARVYASEGSTVRVSAASISSTGLWRNNGINGQVFTYFFDLMTATGSGALLDLSSVTNIDASFTSSGDDHSIQRISALDGGVIDLSGVQTITGPVSGRDEIRLIADGDGSVLNLSGLTTITGAGGGEAYIDITNGGRGWLGNVLTPDITTTINLDAESVLSLASLRAGSPLAIKAPTGGTVRVSGDFRFSHTTTADLDLALANLECVGQWQWLEVGGTDFDLQWEFLPDGNFGYRQLVVGEPGHATVVQLVDLIDNHQAGVPDALYLFGEPDIGGSGGLDGLRILGGSTLVLGEVNAYALLDLDGDGVMERTRLQGLLPPGETRYRFEHGDNDGFIIIPGVHPSIGGIDARAPSEQDGSNPADWMATELVHLGDESPLDPAEFVIEVTRGTAPVVVDARVAGMDRMIVDLDGPVPLDDGAWMTIKHVPTGSKTCVGNLPTDVNGDHSSAPADILDLIDGLNGVRIPGLGFWQCDIDRSGVCAPADILSVIDLLNGAGEFRAWLGRSLPECP